MAAMYRFGWSKHYPADAQAVGEWYRGLRSRSMQAAVEAARNRTCVVHRLLEWDDRKAGKAYRLHQMREIVNSLTVEVHNAKGNTEHVRAFIRSADMSSYVVTVEATDAELDSAERRCIGEMNRMRDRWKGIQLARGVVQEIDSATAQANRRRKKRRG